MLDWIGGERRREVRVDTEDKFRCFMSGRRFQTSATNISAGGAFVRLDRVVRPQTTLVMELVQEGRTLRSPALVARVVYFTIKPVMGAGVQWLRIVSQDGLSALRSFLRERFEMDVPDAELRRFSSLADQEHPMSFDFKTGILNLEKARDSQRKDKIVSMFGIKVSERTMDRLGLGNVRFVQSEAPSKKRAVLREEDSLVGRDDSGEDPLEAARRLEEWMRLKRHGRPIDVQVVLAYQGRNVSARAMSISTTYLFVEAPERLPEPGTRLLVRFPVKTATERVPIIIVAEVVKSLRGSRTEEWGSSLKIVTLNEGERIGIFNRYVSTL
jgi:hypothetical protein